MLVGKLSCRLSGVSTVSGTRALLSYCPVTTAVHRKYGAAFVERNKSNSGTRTLPLSHGVCQRVSDVTLSCRPFSVSWSLFLHATDHLAVDKASKMEQASTDSEKQPDDPDSTVKLSQAQRLKQAVKEYGATVIVFHTCLSLFTLGVAYTAVSSGLDVVGLLSKLGVGQSLLESKLATGASTFVVAYAVHKVFVPARMATTLVAAPLIVRYLRRIGFIKHPVTKT